MPAGIEIYTAQGTRQIDQHYKNYFLLRIVNVACTSPTFSNSNRAWTGSTAYNSGEVVALRSPSSCAYIRTNNGHVVVVTNGGQGAVVTLYFFGPLTISDATSGLQVFHPDTQQLVFCASKKPLRLAGIASGYGEFLYTQGRTYAVVMLQQYYLYRHVVFNNPPQPYLRQWTAERSMIRVGPNGIAVEKVLEINHVDNLADTPRNNSFDSGSAFNPMHLVIDVTNY